MDPIELLSTVNQFYDQAFNRLLIITFGLITFIGVAIPIAVGWLQLRTLRAEKASLLEELKSDIHSEIKCTDEIINKKVQEQIETLKSIYDIKFEEIATNIEKSSASAKARAHHLQANNLLTEAREDLGISDLCYATSLYFTAEEEANARRCMDTIINSCLPNLNSEHFEEHNINDICSELSSEIKKFNQNFRYNDDLKNLEREKTKASNRQPTKAVPN